MTTDYHHHAAAVSYANSLFRPNTDAWDVARAAFECGHVIGVAAGIAAERERVAKEQADADEFNDNERRRVDAIARHKASESALEPTREESAEYSRSVWGPSRNASL